MSTPALFLPGQLTDERLWAPMLAAMPPGLITPHFIHYDRGDSIQAFARHALSGPPEEFLLVGLSLGGYVAFEILRQSPHRVKGLVLFNTSARADDDEKLREREKLKQAAVDGRFAGVTNRLMPTIIHPRHLGNRAITDTIMQMAASVGQEGFLRQQHAIMHRVDSRDLLPHIRVPTVVISGDSDQRTPAFLGEEIAAGINAGAAARGEYNPNLPPSPTNRPLATYHCLKAVGHLAPLEEPEASGGMVSGLNIPTWIACSTP